MRRRVVPSLLVLAALHTVAPAVAGPPGAPAGKVPPVAPAKPDLTDHADDLFKQAGAAIDVGRLADAERMLREAWSLKQTHDIAGNLGLVLVKLGKLGEGVQHITWALRHMPPSESDNARRALQEELARARPQLGALRIRVNVAGAEVAVNGRRAGAAPIADEVFAEPGRVTVVASREGYVAATQTVTVLKGGDAREVVLTLVPAGGPAQRRSAVPGVVLASVAGAALIAGAGIFAAGHAKGSHAGELHAAILAAGHACAQGFRNYDSRCGDVQSAASTANTFQKAGAGLMIVAGAAAAGTVVYFLLPQPKASADKRSGLQLGPMMAPSTGGLVFSGKF